MYRCDRCDMIEFYCKCVEGNVTLPRRHLNYLYAIAYKAGHQDTVDGRYVDVYLSDVNTYWEDEVQEFLGER